MANCKLYLYILCYNLLPLKKPYISLTNINLYKLR